MSDLINVLKNNKIGNNLLIELYRTNKSDLIKLILFLRNPYFGYGNRNILKQFLDFLYFYDKDKITDMVPLIKRYGCWKDIFELYNYNDKSIKDFLLKYINLQLETDLKGDNASNCAKWFPNQNNSRNNSIYEDFCKMKNISFKELRQNYLVPLRIKANSYETIKNKNMDIDLDKVSKYKIYKNSLNIYLNNPLKFVEYLDNNYNKLSNEITEINMDVIIKQIYKKMYGTVVKNILLNDILYQNLINNCNKLIDKLDLKIKYKDNFIILINYNNYEEYHKSIILSIKIGIILYIIECVRGKSKYIKINRRKISSINDIFNLFYNYKNDGRNTINTKNKVIINFDNCILKNEYINWNINCEEISWSEYNIEGYNDLILKTVIENDRFDGDIYLKNVLAYNELNEILFI